MSGFGENLRRLRKERGMSTTLLAERLGSDPNYISRVERGDMDKTVSKLVILARLLNVSTDELVGMEPHVTASQREAAFWKALHKLEIETERLMAVMKEFSE